jgi:hypothetical protein
MKKAVAACTIVASLLSLNAGAEDRTIRFSGEVAQNLEFRKNIGRGLDFVLSPETGSGGITGWTIEVSPHGQPPDASCTDYLWVVTPPFRFDNPRYLSTSYGNTAQIAVKHSPREFNFVLNCEDYKAEYERVEKVLWPYDYSKEAVDDALGKLGTSPHGTGRLWIRDSKYPPGDKNANPPTFGEIHWIKFEVEIKFPTEAKH